MIRSHDPGWPTGVETVGARMREGGPIEDSSLATRAVGGVSWIGAGLLVREGLSLLVRLLLVRLLLPEHFGLVGMAAVFTGLVTTVNELGLAAALIQRREDQLREEHFHTAFWASLVFAASAFLLMVFGVAPLASWFYGEPALRPIIAGLSVPLLVRPFSLIQSAKLARALRFKTIALAETVGVVGSAAVAVFLALSGFGVWSIVTQAILAPIVATPFLWVGIRWVPKRCFSMARFRELFGFGLYMVSGSVLIYITKNVDYLMVGKMLGATDLGLYTLAFTLTDILRSRLMAIMNGVLYPVYSALQDDLESVKTYYLQVLRFNSLLVFPIMAIAIAAAGPIVRLAFGLRWVGAVLPLQLLALAVVIYTWGGTVITVLRSLGRPRLVLGVLSVNAALFLPTVWIGTMAFGTAGTAGAVILNNLVGRFVQQYYMNRIVGVTEAGIFVAIRPALLGSILAAGAVVTAMHVWRIETFLQLCGLLAVGGAVYSAVVVPLVWKDMAKVTRILLQGGRRSC